MGGVSLFFRVYPLVNVYIAMENHIFFMGKSNINCHFQSYVSLPEGIVFPCLSHNDVIKQPVWIDGFSTAPVPAAIAVGTSGPDIAAGLQGDVLAENG